MDLETVYIHSLLRDELTYEVAVRAETPADTVFKLRKQLKSLCLGFGPSEFVDEESDIGKELDTIQVKLKELQGKVDSAEKTRDKYSLARARALYCHLYHRLHRLTCETEKHCVLQEKLKVVIQGYEPTLVKLYTRSEVRSESGKPEVEDSFDSNGTQYAVSKNICKWNVTFDGKSCPFLFLDSIAERAKAFRISDSVLFDSAFAFFKGDALIWYRSAKCQVATWKELTDLLLSEFHAIDYEDNLLDEAKKRIQGNDEPVHMYFAIMNGLFSRLKTPLTEPEKIKILKKNVKPSISRGLVLVKPESVAELKDVARLLEAEDIKSNTYKSTSQSDQKLKLKVDSVDHHDNRSKQTKHKPKPQPSAKEIKCFRCGKLGFTVRNCPECKKEPKDAKN